MDMEKAVMAKVGRKVVIYKRQSNPLQRFERHWMRTKIQHQKFIRDHPREGSRIANGPQSSSRANTESILQDLTV